MTPLVRDVIEGKCAVIIPDLRADQTCSHPLSWRWANCGASQCRDLGGHGVDTGPWLLTCGAHRWNNNFSADDRAFMELLRRLVRTNPARAEAA